MKHETYILDHVADITWTRGCHPIINLHALDSLIQGMYHAAEFVRRQELKRWKPEGVEISWGRDPLAPLLGCMFDWFSVSAVSYLRLVKLVGLMERNAWTLEDLKVARIRKKLRRETEDYLNALMPETYEWRNKIGAHRAASDPRVTDSLLLLEYSTMPTIGYETPYYKVLPFQLFATSKGKLGLQPWALTEVFERLAPRFWPGVELSPFPTDAK